MTTSTPRPFVPKLLKSTPSGLSHPSGNSPSELDEETLPPAFDSPCGKRARGKTPEAEALLNALASFAVYNLADGGFTVIRYRRGHCQDVGETLGTLNNKGYLVTKLSVGYKQSKEFPVSHLVWLWHFGELPEITIDHRNRKTDDNHIGNLRHASRATQSRNRGMRKDNGSGYTGVYFRANRPNGALLWESGTRVNRKYIRHGYFASPEEAVAARAAFIEAHPELGFTSTHGEKNETPNRTKESSSNKNDSPRRLGNGQIFCRRAAGDS